MGAANQSRLEDLKRISILVGIALALGTVTYNVIVWIANVQTKSAAHEQHDAIKVETWGEINEHRRSCDKEHHRIFEELKTQRAEAQEKQREILEDLKIIRTRTWELKERRR